MARSVAVFRIFRKSFQINLDNFPAMTSWLPQTLFKFQNIARTSRANLYVGSNVKLRKELSGSLLGGVNVIAVHGDKNTHLVTKVLADHGANVRHFDIKGVSTQKYTAPEREIDLKKSDDLVYLENVIRKADVFVDGLQKGGLLEKAAARNSQLIVARCDCNDPFSALSAVSSIAMALYSKEKRSVGQHLVIEDKMDYWKELNDSFR
ncbi:unnamed protein product [Caenorhabditis auriculariae]|uniref:Uncharacterized protein n=1 Tax=Caenorhabditis auriculariae TaxID=2777116 RepID=A0A8S1H2S9_9PELO|nr:unnamed protein product [Caenorhabditis auriculariae]